MKEEIESLRENLHELLEIDKCLCSNEIVKLSQELDKLIYAYYSCTAEV
ncbi:aspartyl-phosphate phosphatase Spo0E family protein [Clostridium sp. JS66]|nr:aspartyl-phosphate phosphatase Spo0E family protein [Clostridium sp. JS66]WPC43473.1 aspartyl-phosphate phosphatase Spo0E family protein [Clostridium sp. JS66]